MSDSINGLEQLRSDVLAGQITRRGVLKRGALLGLSAPMIAGLLAACGGDDDDDGDDAPEATSTTAGAAQPTETTAPDAEEPTATTGSTDAAEPTATTGGGAAVEPTATTPAPAEAGGGGLLRLLWWQAPTIINPHLSTGTKDFDASRVCLEPLGRLRSRRLTGSRSSRLRCRRSITAASTEEGTQVTWKLREGSSGTTARISPLRMSSSPGATRLTKRLRRRHAATLRQWKLSRRSTITRSRSLHSAEPGLVRRLHRSEWDDPARACLADCVGAEARDAPVNLMPIGTGPFMVTEFRPGDVVALRTLPGLLGRRASPSSTQVEMKGGGDAPRRSAGGPGDW